MGGFSDLLDINNPQLPDGVVRPECNKQVPDKDELNFSSGIIRLGVVPDLGWIFGKLIEEPDQFSLASFG